MPKAKKGKRVPLRALTFLELLNEYTITVRKSWEWRLENVQASAARSPLYQRELRLKKELCNRLQQATSPVGAKLLLPNDHPRGGAEWHGARG